MTKLVMEVEDKSKQLPLPVCRNAAGVMLKETGSKRGRSLSLVPHWQNLIGTVVYRIQVPASQSRIKNEIWV